MLTIDEAITLVNIEKECINRADNCNRKCNECDLVQDSNKLLDLYEQLAEWLEELKARREADRISDSKPFDVLLVQRYNKAIDDFEEKLKENISESLIWGMIADCFKYKNMNDTSDKIVDYVIDTANEISEQLKAGGDNE